MCNNYSLFFKLSSKFNYGSLTMLIYDLGWRGQPQNISNTPRQASEQKAGI